MTDVINYLNQYQAQQPNMLDSYDDTQGMPRQRPADPLRWLANAIGQNQDLPAPQFFMDPRALSVRNMLHSGLGTAANWLDGTKDPSLIGPQEMVSPLGLAGMGMGVANAVTRPGRDFRIAEQLTRQHPEASAVGTIPRYAPLRDASNPTSAAHVYDYGMLPGASRPANVMADNAKGSAPGTVVNSLDMSEAARMARAKEMGFDTDRVLYHGSQSKFSEFDPSLGHEYGIFLSPNKGYAQPYAGLSERGTRNQPGAYFVRAEKVARPHSTEDLAQSANKHLTKADADRLRAQGIDAIEPKEVPEFVLFDPAKIRSVDAAFDPAKRDSADLLASSPSASAPGLAANSTQPTQQDDQGVMSILRRYGLAD